MTLAQKRTGHDESILISSLRHAGDLVAGHQAPPWVNPQQKWQSTVNIDLDRRFAAGGASGQFTESAAR